MDVTSGKSIQHRSSEVAPNEAGWEAVEKMAEQVTPGVRAAIVTLDSNGKWYAHPVPQDASVLNLERDLIQHLQAYPFSDAWLNKLRDYCESRLTARKGGKS